jgi:hypothetical protein
LWLVQEKRNRQSKLMAIDVLIIYLSKRFQFVKH